MVLGRWQRLRVAILFSILLTLLAGAVVLGSRLLEIVAAYKAKMLCSEVFVAGRAPEVVARELDEDDLWLLRAFDSRVNETTGTTSAAMLGGAIVRQAHYGGDRGCVLAERSAVARWANPPSRIEPGDLARDLSPSVQAVADTAFAEPDPNRPRRTRAVIVVHAGTIVAERYARGFTPDTPILGWSMTKSVMNALVGVLVKEGRLSLDKPAPLHAWQNDDERGTITVDHLLRMSSGLRFDEALTRPVTDVMSMLFDTADMAAFAAGKPVVALPGTRWQYSSGTSVILARMIRDLVGEAAYPSFPRTALFDRLGMRSARIETDAVGTFVGSSLMYATARDWARFGSLFASDGVWNGERILPEGWVGYSRTPAPADADRAFGAHFWLRIAQNYNPSSTPLPADAFHAVGHEGQFVTIIPSRRLVIVRLGKTREAGVWDQARFVDEVLDVLERR